MFDVALGAASTHVLALNTKNEVKMFAAGDSEWG